MFASPRQILSTYLPKENLMELLFFIGICVLVFLIWLYPIVRIAKSDRTGGTEKLLWVLVTAFLFWFAWVLYLIIAPIDKGKQKHDL